jgi:hypothetical protein
MEDKDKIIEKVTKRVQQCLNEIGFNAESNLSKHDGMVHTIMDLNGKSIKVITHVTDREAKPYGSGAISNELARTRPSAAAIRPTLVQQAATKKRIM